MQRIVVPDRFVRIEMKPALAALVLGSGVPGERQRLQATVRKLHQILLQRIEAERVLDLEGRELAVRHRRSRPGTCRPCGRSANARRNSRSSRRRSRRAPICRSRAAWRAGVAIRASDRLRSCDIRRRSRCRQRWRARLEEFCDATVKQISPVKTTTASPPRRMTAAAITAAIRNGPRDRRAGAPLCAASCALPACDPVSFLAPGLLGLRVNVPVLSLVRGPSAGDLDPMRKRTPGQHSPRGLRFVGTVREPGHCDAV